MSEYGGQCVYDKKRFPSVHDGTPEKKPYREPLKTAVFKGNFENTIVIVSAKRTNNCIGQRA